MKKDYANLKQLLEDTETFPLRFTFKFIGKTTPGFAKSVEALERRYPLLRPEATRTSAGGNHTAKTYAYDAPDAESIIEIFQAIERVVDLQVVL